MIGAYLILGTVVGILLGAVAHLITNGSLKTLIAYLFLGVIGFWAGHFVGVLWGFFGFGKLGSLFLLNGIIFSILFLVLGYFAKININTIED